MICATPAVALLYDNSAYVETLQRPQQLGPDSPAGLVGREVAGREFLDAYLTHGDWSELTAVVYNRDSAETLRRFFEQPRPAARAAGASYR
jgi:hypothetical protein